MRVPQSGRVFTEKKQKQQGSCIQVKSSQDDGQGEARGSAPGTMTETTRQRGRLSTTLGNSTVQSRNTDDFWNSPINENHLTKTKKEKGQRDVALG